MRLQPGKHRLGNLLRGGAEANGHVQRAQVDEEAAAEFIFQPTLGGQFKRRIAAGPLEEDGVPIGKELPHQREAQKFERLLSVQRGPKCLR